MFNRRFLTFVNLKFNLFISQAASQIGNDQLVVIVSMYIRETYALCEGVHVCNRIVMCIDPLLLTLSKKETTLLAFIFYSVPWFFLPALGPNIYIRGQITMICLVYVPCLDVSHRKLRTFNDLKSLLHVKYCD